MEVVEWSRGGAGCLWWHRNDAFLDDDGGDKRGGRGGLWEEMKGDLGGMSGGDVHGGSEGRSEREQGRGCRSRSDVQAKVKRERVTCKRLIKR